MHAKVIGLIAGIALILGGWYFFSAKPAKAPTATTGVTSVTIVYGPQGFSPANITVRAGTKVTFMNQSNNQMWIASAMHPSHVVYDGTTRDQHCAAGYTGAIPFDECASVGSGATYSFTFTKAGTWGYHNHVSAGDYGKVTVTAN